MRRYVCAECTGMAGEKYIYQIPESKGPPIMCPFVGHGERYQRLDAEE